MYSKMFTDQILHYPPTPLKWKSNPEIAPNCPRCASPNTKFCYYNNYSLSQPRYFCKGCRRYWTKGGSLRNVPVGGGCRRNRRSKAVRSLEHHRVRINPPNPDHSTTGSTVVRASGPEGSDIDLADVFAKFLNQNGSESGNHVDPLLDLPGALEIESQTSDQLIDNGLDLGFVGDNYDLQDHSAHEELMVVHDHDPNVFGLDISWSDGSNSLQNFDWQPVVEFSEFGSFSSDDQSRGSNNLVGDCWNSFDLSAYI